MRRCGVGTRILRCHQALQKAQREKAVELPPPDPGVSSAVNVPLPHCFLGKAHLGSILPNCLQGIEREGIATTGM